MFKLIFAVLAVFSAILPTMAEDNCRFISGKNLLALPAETKFINGKFYVYDLDYGRTDSVGRLLPAVTLKSEPRAPTGMEVKSEWLINLYQHPDLSMTVEEKILPTKFSWQGFIPKYRDNKKILVGKYSSADSSCQEFQWQEIPGQTKTSTRLIVFISILFVAPLLTGLSIRIKNKNVAAVAVIVAAVVVMVVALNAMPVAVAAAAPVSVMIIMVVATAVGVAVTKHLKASVLLTLISIIFSTAIISLPLSSLPAFGTIVGLEAVIFFAARYLSIAK
jgi:hypothetical protein